MATLIVVGDTYFVDFEGGQGLPNVDQYFSYAEDLDTNFVTLRSTVNSVIEEVRGISGPNALFGQDVMFTDDITILNPSVNSGRIGVNPVTVTINGTTTLLDISPGAMAISGVRTDIIAQQKTSSGGAGTRYVAMDVTGAASTSAAPGSQLVDVASVNWDGAQFTGPVTDLIETFLDGDEWYQCRTEPANSPFVTGTYRGTHSRLDNFSRYLGGFATSTEGDAIGAQIIGGGTAAAPRIGLSDGTASVDANTGLYRSAASQLSFSTGSTERVRMNVNGLAVTNGAAGTPSLALFGSTGLGLYHHAANEIGFAVSSADAMTLRGTQLRAVNGSAASPFYSFDATNRDTSGMYSPADNELGLASNGTDAIRINSSQVIDLPAQPAGSATRAGLLNIANNTAVAILMTAEDFDVTAQHDNATNPDRVTIGTGESGVYQVSAQVSFDESTGNGGAGGAAGLRLLEITVNGTTRGRQLLYGDGTNDLGLACATTVSLADTDIIRAVATQVTGGTMDVINSRISWSKVA